MTEIERKFRVDEVPGLDGAETTAIEQGYLAVDAGAEVRLRRTGTDLRLTAKTGHGEVREEAGIELAPEDFERLWALTAGRRLEKVRHRVPLDGGLCARSTSTPAPSPGCGWRRSSSPTRRRAAPSSHRHGWERS